MSERTGKKLKLDLAKVRKMFNLVLELDSDKLVANKLNITLKCFIDYKNRGKNLEEKFEKVLDYSGLYDYDMTEYYDIFNSFNEEYKRRFLESIGTENESVIANKYKREFNHYLKKQELIYLEDIIFNKELEILNKIPFTENKTLDSDIKLFIMFYRTYKRAKCALEEDYLMKYKEVLTDPKNVKELRGRLNKLDKEEFAEEPIDKTVNHNVKFSLIDGLLQYEKAKGILPAQNNNLLTTNNELEIIDADYQIDEDYEEDS